MAEFEILYGKGISREGEIIDYGVEQDLIEKSGSWYSYKEERIGQGKENVREFLRSNPKISSELEGQIRAKLLPKEEDLPKSVLSDENEDEPADS
jgi:recombination protein RecA